MQERPANGSPCAPALLFKRLHNHFKTATTFFEPASLRSCTVLQPLRAVSGLGTEPRYSAGVRFASRLSIRRSVSSLPMNEVTSYIPGPLPAPTSASRSVFITWPTP